MTTEACELALATMLVTYDPLLVAASVLIAIMGSFTGLRLAHGLSHVPSATRKAQLARAAVAIGGGIWSMHFVGMLAVELPVAINYDALLTIGSVLIAILITGLGLYLMHMGPRTLAKTVGAGTLTGLGIMSMHYVGMAAIGGNCVVSYRPSGFFVSGTISVVASIMALSLAYRHQTVRQISLGAVVLGITISCMHYSAMAYTSFLPVETAVALAQPMISDSYLAIVVALAAFLVCGLFLLTALPLADETRDAIAVEPATAADVNGSIAVAESPGETAGRAQLLRVPYEHNKAIFFLPANRICAIKAEGHYTRLYDGTSSFFCPWSISRLEGHLSGRPFMRIHRSFMLNLDRVQALQRDKDRAHVLVEGSGGTRVPVSRSYLPQLRRALGV